MDINANLKEQRELLARLLADQDGADVYAGAQEQMADVARLCELVQAMDEWLPFRCLIALDHAAGAGPAHPAGVGARSDARDYALA